MLQDFVKENDYLQLKEKIQKIKMNSIESKAKFPFVYEITQEYYEAFKSY